MTDTTERAALRRLASQDQEPVAHPYVKNIDGSPLYLSPPPAPGWDDSIITQSDLKTALDSALRATPAATKSADDGGGVREAVLRQLESLAEKQKAYFNAKQHKFPSIEDFTDGDGNVSLPDDITPLVHHAEANGRYSEADWWLSTIRAALSHQPAPVAANASAEARLREDADTRITHTVRSLRASGLHDDHQGADAIEALVYERNRWRDVAEKQASWEALWAEAASQVDQLTDALHDIATDVREHGDDSDGIIFRMQDRARSVLSAHPHASDCAKQGETRPANCRFRLQDEGKSYPRSSCSACGKNIATGLGNRCKESPSDRTADVTVGELTRFIERMNVHFFGWENELAEDFLNAFTVGRR